MPEKKEQCSDERSHSQKVDDNNTNINRTTEVRR